MEFPPDEEAALTCIAALTAYFDPVQVDKPLTFEYDAEKAVEFLFGVLVGVVEVWCEETGKNPNEWVRGLALHVQSGFGQEA